MTDQWDIWTYDFPGVGAHPVVLISPPHRARNSPVVNVLYCTSQRQNRPPKPNEVMLDEEDGLDWESLCACDVMYIVQRAALREQRGRVGSERRRAIGRKIVDLYRLLAG